jgi:hypothetical protein
MFVYRDGVYHPQERVPDCGQKSSSAKHHDWVRWVLRGGASSAEGSTFAGFEHSAEGLSVRRGIDAREARLLARARLMPGDRGLARFAHFKDCSTMRPLVATIDLSAIIR